MTQNRKIRIFLFCFLVFCYSFIWHKPNWNDLGRYDLIMAISEQGTVHIDTFQSNTGDKAIFNGHYYSDKAPGPAFLGVPVYWILSRIQNLMVDPQNHIANVLWWGFKMQVVRILVIAIPSAFLGVLLFTFLSSIPIPQSYALWLTLGFSLGTMAFPYSTLFYGHQFAAVCLFTAFIPLYSLLQPEICNLKSKILKLWVAGFLAGYGIFSEYPVALLALVLIIYLWVKEKNIKSMFYFFSGMAIPIIILLYYNYLCSGNIFKLGYFHVAGEQFRAEMSQGIAGVTYPKLSALWGITFSLYRGLFLINPFLLFAIPGYFYMFREPRWRKEFWVSVSAVLLFLLFNSSYYMWWGGWANGPRHLIPVLPFLILPIAFLPRKYWDYLCALIVLSMLFMWLGSVIDPQVPESARNPLFGYAFDHLQSGKVSPNIGTLLFLGSLNGAYLLGLAIIVTSWFLFRKVEKTISH